MNAVKVDFASSSFRRGPQAAHLAVSIVAGTRLLMVDDAEPESVPGEPEHD